MGNRPTTAAEQESMTVELPPPPSPLLDDRAAREGLAVIKAYGTRSDMDKLQRYARPITPPVHFQEYMVLKGDFDLDLTDPALAHLFEDPPKS